MHKIVLLKPEQYNSRNDIFEDVSVKEDSFSFTMVLPRYANRIEIQGDKRKGKLFHSIKGEGPFKGLYPGNKPGRIEWRQVDKVVLP